MLIPLLPLISLLTSQVLADSDSLEVTTPRAAQVRLAEVLAQADAIYAVTPSPRTRTSRDIAFDVARDGHAQRVVATVDARGQVIALAIVPALRAMRQAGERGDLGWLSHELADALAITTLDVSRDGAITASTNDERSYRLIHARGGNAGVEARWAAAWETR